MILIAEENQTFREAASKLLSDHGYGVHAVRTGLDALDALDQVEPDLLLCDIKLQGLDGYELLERIRTHSRWQHLPVIFVTAYNSTAHVRKARQLGIEDYLVKPVDWEDLVIAVQNALRRQQRLEAIAQARVEGLRQQIVGMMQHEFRTPLTFVMGYAEYLRDTLEAISDALEALASVEAILEGGRRLHHLVENFLLLTDLAQRKRAELQRLALDAGTLWQAVIEDRRPLLERSPLQVTLRPDASTVQPAGDASLLRRALACLLENAIYYCRADSRAIWLSIESTSGFTGWRVEDEGIGIPAEYLHQIGQPFVRLEEARSLHHGAGLGLAIVRQIAHLHGGYLEVSSEHDKGSRFTLWLPAEP
jgi:signal transduction histidine kinase